MPDWRAQASCVGTDPEAFFAPLVSGEVKRTCEACPVLAECREWSLTFLPSTLAGYWGGTTQQQRRAIWRRRRQAGSYNEVQRNGGETPLEFGCSDLRTKRA